MLDVREVSGWLPGVLRASRQHTAVRQLLIPSLAHSCTRGIGSIGRRDSLGRIHRHRSRWYRTSSCRMAASPASDAPTAVAASVAVSRPLTSGACAFRNCSGVMDSSRTDGRSICWATPPSAAARITGRTLTGTCISSQPHSHTDYFTPASTCGRLVRAPRPGRFRQACHPQRPGCPRHSARRYGSGWRPRRACGWPEFPERGLV